jgi:hypothetical protein
MMRDPVSHWKTRKPIFHFEKDYSLSENHEKNFPLNPVIFESGTLCAEDHQVLMKIL